MKLAVVGSREYTNDIFMNKVLDYICIEYGISEIVSGGARGVDSIAADYARNNHLKLTEFTVEKEQWHILGKSAGPMRNRKIIAYSDMMVAFWDGVSPGTKSSISFASRKGMCYYVYNTSNNTVEKYN